MTHESPPCRLGGVLVPAAAGGLVGLALPLNVVDARQLINASFGDIPRHTPGQT